MRRKTIELQVESITKYIVNALGLTSGSRAGKRAVRDNIELIGAFRRALLQEQYLLAIRKRDSYIIDYINGYKNNAVTAVKIADVPLKSNEPALVCVIKDDLRRVKAQLPHHRRIGIRHFAYIDNESTDGTFEFLREQDDVSLFNVPETFNPGIKNAWVRQVTDVLGYDRWYLKLDSDEFFVYPGAENIPIPQYIDFLESKGIEAVLAPMIDMYSSNQLFRSAVGLGFQDEYCWFDANSYTRYATFQTQGIVGGPRQRLFRSHLQLSKYPLIKAKESFLLSDHSNYPYKLNFYTNGAAAFLLHYKFLDEDYSKFMDQIMTGVHVNKSRDQKTYIRMFDDNPDMSFYYEDSQKLTNSMDLLKIDICDREFFEGLLK